MRHSGHQYRAKIRQQEAISLSRKYGWVCWYCGIGVRSNYVIDHIIPKSRGGGEEGTNKALACHPCNRAKNDMELQEFLEYIDWMRSSRSTSVIKAEWWRFDGARR